jgi:hypothetical protein
MTSPTDISRTEVNIVFDAFIRLNSTSIRLIILHRFKFFSNQFPCWQVATITPART